MSCRLRVDDNFHYMDASERRDRGCFATLDAAVEAAKAIVDSYLDEAYKPGMTARELFESYTSFGEDAFIVMYVVAQLEAETERRLPWDQLMGIKTVGELVDLVLKTPKGR